MLSICWILLFFTTAPKGLTRNPTSGRTSNGPATNFSSPRLWLYLSAILHFESHFESIYSVIGGKHEFRYASALSMTFSSSKLCFSHFPLHNFNLLQKFLCLLSFLPFFTLFFWQIICIVCEGTALNENKTLKLLLMSCLVAIFVLLKLAWFHISFLNVIRWRFPNIFVDLNMFLQH